MEFWGVEVKPGETLKVSPGEGKVIHLSQASIGEAKKGKDELVPVHVKVGEQKLVIGTLSVDKFPQIQYDVVFEKDFELSHNWKSGSVYFCGYKTQNPEDGEGYSGDEFDSDSEDEEVPVAVERGITKPAKADASGGKPSVKAEELANGDGDEDSSDDDDFSGSDEDSSDDDDDKMDADDSEDDDSSEEDEKTPTPKKENKKRPTEPEATTPVPSKKAKIATPQKTDGKKGTTAHTATPHPSKPASKATKSENAKTPASAGKPTCNSCSKTFNSDKALESHSKAKHAAK